MSTQNSSFYPVHNCEGSYSSDYTRPPPPATFGPLERERMCSQPYATGVECAISARTPEHAVPYCSTCMHPSTTRPPWISFEYVLTYGGEWYSEQPPPRQEVAPACRSQFRCFIKFCRALNWLLFYANRSDEALNKNRVL